MRAADSQRKGPTAPEAGEPCLIPRVAGEPDWARIPVLPIRRVLWTPDAGIRAWGQLCRDEEALFVHLRAEEKEIRAENTAPGSPVWEDSCLEFFFLLPGADRYFNFELNPNGCLCLQLGRERAGRVDLAGPDARELFRIRTERTGDGWEVFYRIPLAFLRRFYPDCRFAGELRANLYKCGDKTPKPHFLSWAPVRSETPDFHRPQDFGRMRFEE